MKKFLLLITTAVVSINFAHSQQVCLSQEELSKKFVARLNAEEKPELIISGAAAVHASFTHPNYKYYKNNPDHKSHIKSTKDSSETRISAGEANIAFEARGKLNNGLRYNAVIDLDAMKDATGVDKMYVSFAKDDIGTIQIGNLKGPEAKCIYSGQELIGGTCGVDGTVTHDIEYAPGVLTPLHMIGYTGKATKFVYYSPRMFGFQFAASLTPDTNHSGHNDRDWHSGSSSAGNEGMFIKTGKTGQPSGKCNTVFSLSHFHEFDSGLSTKFSIVYLRENTRGPIIENLATDNPNDYLNNGKPVKMRNARAFHLSGTIGYKKFQIGAGYIYNGKSRTPKEDYLEKLSKNGAGTNAGPGNFLSDDKANAGRAWNIGMRYNMDEHWTFSAVFHKTKRSLGKKHTFFEGIDGLIQYDSKDVSITEKSRGTMFTFAIDYKVCDGLLLFAEFDQISTKTSDTACTAYNACYTEPHDKHAIKKQHAGLIALGAKISF